jgi:hypothetical protein
MTLLAIVSRSSIIPYGRVASSPAAAVVAGPDRITRILFRLNLLKRFQGCGSPARTLGVNMLGAVLGGLLEEC